MRASFNLPTLALTCVQRARLHLLQAEAESTWVSFGMIDMISALGSAWVHFDLPGRPLPVSHPIQTATDKNGGQQPGKSFQTPSQQTLQVFDKKVQKKKKRAIQGSGMPPLKEVHDVGVVLFLFLKNTFGNGQ